MADSKQNILKHQVISETALRVFALECVRINTASSLFWTQRSQGHSTFRNKFTIVGVAAEQVLQDQVKLLLFETENLFFMDVGL